MLWSVVLGRGPEPRAHNRTPAHTLPPSLSHAQTSYLECRLHNQPHGPSGRWPASLGRERGWQVRRKRFRRCGSRKVASWWVFGRGHVPQYTFAAAMDTDHGHLSCDPTASHGAPNCEESSNAGVCICCASQSSALADVKALPAKDGNSVQGGSGYSVLSCPDPA